jgi:predicted MFS family arabinose efflux permease
MALNATPRPRRPPEWLRWPMVGAMFLANAMPEFLWSNFPPIMSDVAQRYGAGPTLVGLVIESFSIGTVLSAGIAGRLIDSRGYRATILLGLFALVVFSALRAIDGPFWIIVVAQAGIGATLPFITGATSSFVVDWFEPSQESRVTGLCMVGVFAGLAASMVYSPWAFSSWGFGGLMRSAAALSLALLLIAYPLMQQRTLRRPAQHGARKAGFRWILNNRSLWVLLAGSFLAQGCFSAIAAGLELVWHGHGMTPANAGLANALFIVGGAMGSLLLPVIQDRFQNGRSLLIVCYIAPILFTYPLFSASTPMAGNVFALLLGLFWLGNLPVSITLLQRAAGAEHAGMASSLYWGFGNGGVIAIVALFDVALEFTHWQFAVGLMLLLSCGTLVLAFLLPRDRPLGIPSMKPIDSARAARGS